MLLNRLKDSLLSKHSRIFWKYRHLVDRKWADVYSGQVSLAHPHRAWVTKAVEAYNVQSLLEIGCASGPNLFLLAIGNPDAKFYGWDISRNAIEVGRRIHGEFGNIIFYTPDQEWDGRSYDVILTDAALIYFNPEEVRRVIEKMKRVVTKAIIMVEWHSNRGSFVDYAHWVHNYRALFDGNTKFSKFPAAVWPAGGWKEHGYLITWEKRN